MKRYKLLLLIVVLPFFMSSCNGWLNVEPEDQISEEDLFALGNGYRHALNGVYYGMSASGLYGKELTWGFVDALGQCYNYTEVGTPANPMRYGAAKYDWERYDVKPLIEKVWQDAYNTVANCNNIVQNIAGEDPEKFAYKNDEKYMIWGEALALRAFIQFDMLRLFAAAPASNPGEKTYIPYVSTYPTYVSNKLTVDSCLSFIVADLKEARKLLWKVDSSTDMTRTDRMEAAKSGDALFTSKRGFRLNYYAATALLARVYLYAQKSAEAYTVAKELIDYQDKKKAFDYSNRTSSGDIKFYGDVIWGVESLDLLKYVSEFTDLSNPDDYYHRYLKVLDLTTNFFDGDFIIDENTEIGKCSDRRYMYWTSNVGNNNTDFMFSKFNKYDLKGYTQAEISNYLVPLIRMSEVYYIAAEAIYQTNLPEAKKYLEIVKKGRGLTASNLSLSRMLESSKSDFFSYLKNDARREWLGEGQIYFMYKRLNEKIPAERGGFISAEDKIFIVPLPDVEMNVN